MIQLCRHNQRQVGIILSNKDNNIMTKKYFNYQGAPWQIIETTDPWGTPMVYAIEMNSTDGAMLGTEQYSHASDWEYVEATDVRIDEWFLRSDPNDLFIGDDEYDEQYEKEHDDPEHPVHPVNTSKLKAMLEQLNNRPTDGPTRHWSIQYDDDMNRHERLKASLEESNRTVGQAADILGMIRARQETVEMPPTVILNENKYPDSASLEQAINAMKQRHGDHAHIRIGKHGADDLLATYKNQETIGLSSIMDSAQGINIDFDAETLELIMKMKPKSN